MARGTTQGQRLLYAFHDCNIHIKEYVHSAQDEAENEKQIKTWNTLW